MYGCTQVVVWGIYIYIDKFGGTVLLSHRVILYPHLYLWHTLTCVYLYDMVYIHRVFVLLHF